MVVGYTRYVQMIREWEEEKESRRAKTLEHVKKILRGGRITDPNPRIRHDCHWEQVSGQFPVALGRAWSSPRSPTPNSVDAERRGRARLLTHLRKR